MLRTAHIAFIVLLASSASAQEVLEVAALNINPTGEDYSPVPLDGGFVMCSVREVSGTIGFTDAEIGKDEAPCPVRIESHLLEGF